MAEEFQLRGGNWWENNTSISTNRFDSGSSSTTPTASTSAATSTTTVSNYSSSNWPTETDQVDIKPRNTFLNSVSVSQSSGHDVGGGRGGSDGVVLPSHDPNFQIMGLGLTSQGQEWNHQSLLRGKNNYHPEENSHQDHNWSRQINIRGFSLDQNNPIFSQSSSSTMSQLGGLYNINNSSNYEVADNHQVLHLSTTNSWSKFPQFLRQSSPLPEQPLLSPLPPPPHSQLHFSNNTPFWNASAGAMDDVPSSLFPSNLHNPQLPNPTFDEKAKNMGEFRDTNRLSSKKTSSTETTNKRPRNETPSPSPSPAFKVRKEKMGDRITALQQLVSPFGKTDTASVLSEAIEYIKFLHDQIGALSSPYMKSGASMQQHQQSGNKSKDVEEEREKNMRGRGLCLVPISSTFPVTHETTVDLWTPTFGSTFR